MSISTLLLACALSFLTQDSDDWLYPTLVDGKEASLYARIEYPEQQKFVPGLPARQVIVLLRNESSDLAIALRYVGWAGLPGEENWHMPVYGTTREEKGRTVIYDPMAQNMTDLTFEHGLILPGEQLRVRLPLHVQPRPNYELNVSYAIVGDDIRLWHNEILLPKDDDPLLMEFVTPYSESLERRGGEGGGLALCRATMKEGYIVFEGHLRYQVRLPLAEEIGREQTGGITAREAGERSGCRPEVDTYHYFYQPLLQTWFILRAADGSTATLRKQDEKWEFDVFSNRWDLDTPIEFGATGSGTTRILLDEETFGDLVKVKKPKTGLYYDPGATELNARQLWKVLVRASKRKLDVKSVSVNPNGFGLERFLTIGVEVDDMGRRVESP